MRFMSHRGPKTHMAGSLAPFALAAEQFPLIPLLSEVVVWRAIAGNSQATSTASFHVVLCRMCHTCFSALDRTPNPQSEPAVIVRHRIVEPRLDDELAAVEDARHHHRFPYRRSRAWRDANAVIANLVHPLVYAPGANMPQDALDDLRVVYQRHGAHFVLKLGCHRDTAADQLPRPS